MAGPTKADLARELAALRRKAERDAVRARRLGKKLADESASRQQAEMALGEALVQHAATACVLEVMSGAPADLAAVLDAIAEQAARVCEVAESGVLLAEGDRLTIAALYPTSRVPTTRSYPLDRGSVAGRAVVEQRTIQVEDLADADEAEYPVGRAQARETGMRTVLSTPLLRDGRAVGAITIVRRDQVKLFAPRQVEQLRIFAAQAVIALEHTRVFTELGARNSDLAEALEQQTATSEVLRVISSSPAALPAVYDVILERITRLCEADIAALFLYDGEFLSAAASHGTTPPFAAHLRHSRPRPSRETTTRLAALERRPVHAADLLNDPQFAPRPRDLYEDENVRTVLSVPMLREDRLIGVLTTWRREVRPFADKQVTLLQTFADQAVIAVENARLFTELEARNTDLTESLEQQTATADILRVISSSPTDVQPVFETIARSVVRLCQGLYTYLSLFDGEVLTLVAFHNVSPAALEILRRRFPSPPTRGSSTGRAILERTVVHIPDVSVDSKYQFSDLAQAHAYRAILAVPMLREGVPIGAITVGRHAPFTENQMAVVKTFADQAVIAIENVRLLEELEARNAEVSETLARQTATGEVLRAIIRAQTDSQPVFDIIAASALRLCGAGYGQVALYDGEWLHLAALDNVNPEGVEALRRRFPMRADHRSAMGRAILTRAVVQIPDVLEDPAYAFKSELVTMGFRSVVTMPMLRTGEPIGGIAVGRPEPGPFSHKQIELLQTFADQAVIAIENVRLFKELQARTQELTRSVGELRALGEVGQAVSSTLDLETVLTTIVSRAVQLSGTDGGSIYEYDEAAEEFALRATHNLDEEYVELRRGIRLKRGEGVTGRMALARGPVQVPDITAPGAYDSRLREVLFRSGARAVLAVPLLREDHLVGGLVVNRSTPGEFPPEVVALFQTFATQSALAIQNARLFKEIEAKSRELEVAGRHKSEFLANMSHELRTPLNAIIGYSEMLEEDAADLDGGRLVPDLQKINAAGKHLLELINAVLDLSKIDADARGALHDTCLGGEPPFGRGSEVVDLDLERGAALARREARGQRPAHRVVHERIDDPAVDDAVGIHVLGTDGELEARPAVAHGGAVHAEEVGEGPDAGVRARHRYLPALFTNALHARRTPTCELGPKASRAIRSPGERERAALSMRPRVPSLRPWASFSSPLADPAAPSDR